MPETNDDVWEQAAADAEARVDAEPKSNGCNMALPPPSQPAKVAADFIAERCLTGGCLTLRNQGGAWWGWRTTHWTELHPREVRATLWNYTANAMYLNDDAKLKPWAPTGHKISDLLEALQARTILSEQEFAQPCWLDGRATGQIVACTNGLLDVTRRVLLDHSPLYFNRTHVALAYDAKAPEPKEWHKFLKALWPSEPKAIDLLAEWYGYVLSGRTDLHKIFLCVGPTRGGKGLIGRILKALLGAANVAGPTLNQLGTDFGLAPLVGASLALISDARFAGRDASVVIERLLSISGEDTMTINRKYQEHWTGKLSARLHIISNELPRLGDASTAIVGRMLLALTDVSWLGREDITLEPRLLGELSGILNWSLQGLARLEKNGGRFTVVPSSEDAINQMRDLASPVAAFVRECCVVGYDYSVPAEELYKDYRRWAEDNGHSRLSAQTFGRDLRAACPRVRRIRPRESNPKRTRFYDGIALKKGGDGDDPENPELAL
jgi:putative DNA primase/helicase